MVRSHPSSGNRSTATARLLSWVVSCGSGVFLGMGVSGTTIFLMNRWLGDTLDDDARMLALSIMLLAGVAEGGLLGFFQWRVLRKLLPGMTAKSWIGITILSAVISWGLGMMPINFFEQQVTEPTVSSPLWQVLLGVVGMGLVLGALFGLMQNMVLKHFLPNQWQWPLYNMLGWGVAMGWVFLGTTLVQPEWSLPSIITTGAIVGGLGGLSLGGITAIFLVSKGGLNLT